MHHEEEERYHERHDMPRRHPRHEAGQQNFRSRWEEPRPFMSDRERRNYEEEMRERAHYQNRDQRQQRDEISRHQHGFSDDHHSRDRNEQRREWHQGHDHYSPENQHARDRWQQHEPPLREQRHRGQSRRDQDWEERGW